MRTSRRVACVLLAICAFAKAQQSNPDVRRQPVAIRDLVLPGDPLARQDLNFDTSFAQLALQYIESNDPGILNKLANSAAATHLLDHARNFDYDVPKSSAQALVSHLLTPASQHAIQAEACRTSLAYFTTQILSDPHWVNDTLRYLPEDFRFHGTLFLIFGYDIGVAFGQSASLNCAHSHFAQHPAELEYYAIHELHHTGFMSYQPPPRLSDIKTCSDLLRLVQYSTQLEGMAVLAAYQRRRDQNALNDDGDYVALQDEARMRRDEALYLDDLHYLERRGAAPADAEAWAVVQRMSSGERLWYRVGARMAQRIEQASGRSALTSLIKQGPASFLNAYQHLIQQAPSGVPAPSAVPLGK